MLVSTNYRVTVLKFPVSSQCPRSTHMSYSLASCHMPEFLPAGRQRKKDLRSIQSVLQNGTPVSTQRKPTETQQVPQLPVSPAANTKLHTTPFKICLLCLQIQSADKVNEKTEARSKSVHPARVQISKHLVFSRDMYPQAFRDPKFLLLQTIPHNFFLSLGWQSGVSLRRHVPTSSPTKPWSIS